MPEINWAKKLSSRKFWALVGAFWVSCAAAFGVSAGQAQAIAGVLAAAGSCAVYILAEGAVDRAHSKGDDSE